MTITVFLATLLGTLGVGVPVAFALLACGVALMIHLDTFDTQILAQNMINGADSFSLLAIPFFMLAGEFMNAGGLSRRIIDMCMVLVGHIRGGLGFVAIFACVLMASMSGSAVADTAAVGALLIPMMKAAGYNVNRSSGLIAAGGIIAPIIPPSIPFIIFGVAGGLSISKLFLAGIVPGILMGTGLLISWLLLCGKENVTPAPRQPLSEIVKKLGEGFWALLIPIVIVGGIKLGVFTPTEAAVVAAVYSFVVARFIYGELQNEVIYPLILAAAKTTALVMFLVAAAQVSSWLITIADLPVMLIGLLEPLLDSPTLLMTVIMLVVLLIGMVLDLTPAVLILTPVLLPVVKQAGIDPIYFGVLFVMNVSIGLITPPVGTVLNVITGVAKISMSGVVKGIWPFLLVHLIVLSLLVLFPSLVLVPLKWFA